MCSTGADLEILHVNHGGHLLLSLHLLSVGLLLFGAAQEGWLEVLGVCLTLPFFSFPEGGETCISRAGQHHYCQHVFKTVEYLRCQQHVQHFRNQTDDHSECRKTCGEFLNIPALLVPLTEQLLPSLPLL